MYPRHFLYKKKMAKIYLNTSGNKLLLSGKHFFKSSISFFQLFAVPEALLPGAKKLNDGLFFEKTVTSCHLGCPERSWAELILLLAVYFLCPCFILSTDFQ